MRMRIGDKKKLFAGVAVVIGVLILLFSVPFWVWLVSLGFALIAAGLLILMKKC